MDYTPPPANDLPEANPEYCAMLRRELDAIYETSLAKLRSGNDQQKPARVRILRGGYRGDLATVTGRGLADGVTVKTDSGIPLAFPVDALQVVEA
jgi:hypothetical protein